MGSRQCRPDGQREMRMKHADADTDISFIHVVYIPPERRAGLSSARNGIILWYRSPARPRMAQSPSLQRPGGAGRRCRLVSFLLLSVPLTLHPPVLDAHTHTYYLSHTPLPGQHSLAEPKSKYPGIPPSQVGTSYISRPALVPPRVYEFSPSFFFLTRLRPLFSSSPFAVAGEHANSPSLWIPGFCQTCSPRFLFTYSFPALFSSR